MIKAAALPAENEQHWLGRKAAERLALYATAHDWGCRLGGSVLLGGLISRICDGSHFLCRRRLKQITDCSEYIVVDLRKLLRQARKGGFRLVLITI